MIGFGKMSASADQPAEAGEPHPRGHRGHRAAAVERDDREQVEEVQEEAGERERAPQVVAGRVPDQDAGGRADAAEDRSGEPDPRLGERVVTERAGADHRAEERDEHRRARLDAFAPQLDHVADLVDEEQHDEADANVHPRTKL